MRTQQWRETKPETKQDQSSLETQRPLLEASPNFAAHDFAKLSIFPSNPVIQRQPTHAEAQDARTETQLPAVSDHIQNPGNGTPLPEAARAQFETTMNTDFSDVRIHPGQNHLAPNALAFTTGSNVFTKSGFDLSQPSDRAILGHELAHVIQQRSGRVMESDQASIDPDVSLESEADQLGTRAANGEAVQIPGASQTGSTRASKVVQRLSASVSFAVDALNTANSKVNSASMERGEGTAGGNHSTAFSVFLDAATNAVFGKTFLDAVAALMALVDAVPNLPNYKLSKLADSNSVALVDSKILQIKGNANYTSPNNVHDLNKSSVLQKLMVDYAEMRNKVPGTLLTNASKRVGGQSEKEGLQAMQGVDDEFRADPSADNTGGKLTKQFAKGMVGTFDFGALPLPLNILRMAGAGTILGNHIKTVLSAYPSVPQNIHVNIVKNFMTQIFTPLQLTTPQKKNQLRDSVSISTGFDLGT